LTRFLNLLSLYLNMNNFQPVLDYILNKFCPYIVIGLLLFLGMGVIPGCEIAILFMIYFIDRFNFNVGHAVGVHDPELNSNFN